MISKTTQQADNQTRIFINAWIVMFSFLTGVAVIVVAILAGWPIFIHLFSRIAS